MSPLPHCVDCNREYDADFVEQQIGWICGLCRNARRAAAANFSLNRIRRDRGLTNVDRTATILVRR